MNIDNILKTNEEFIEFYNKNIAIGKEYLKNKTFIIVGLVRNVGNILNANIEKISNILQQTKDYKIFLFENDSTDDTKEILKQISINNHNFYYRSENNVRKQYGTTREKERTQALSEYRNLYLEWIKQNYSDYDFTVVVDLDFKDFSKDGFYNSLGWFEQLDLIDGISGNSFEYKQIFGDNKSNHLWNYDSWAYRGNWWVDQNTLANLYSYNPSLWFGFWIPPVGSNIIKVNSAFGGMTIYKTNKLLFGQYEGYDCEHVCLHKNLSLNPEGFNLFLNPSQRMIV